MGKGRFVFVLFFLNGTRTTGYPLEKTNKQKDSSLQHIQNAIILDRLWTKCKN